MTDTTTTEETTLTTDEERKLAELQAQLDALRASTPPEPAIFKGEPTEEQHAAASARPRKRGTSPIRTKRGR